MPVDPSRSEQVGPALLAFLRKQLGEPALHFLQEPTPLGDGWETYMYGFRLAAEGVSHDWREPLVLRIFPRADLGPRARRETAVQRFVVERGFRAPRPLAVEAEGAAIGLPFMIMERANGRTLFDRLSANPLTGRRYIPLMAETHAALHQLPTEGCPLPSDGVLVERKLVDFRARLERFGIDGLEAEFRWLEANKGTVLVEEVSLCHGDYHPQNILAEDDGRLSVLDWSGASLGDRHHDLGATLTMMRTAPAPPGTGWVRVLDRFGRRAFVWRYLRTYRRVLPVDPERLRYWEALEAFEWLLRVSAMKKVGSAAYGIRADAAERLPPAQLATLRRYFWSRARVPAQDGKRS